MTTQEARELLTASENQITGTYSRFLNSARNIGASADQAASSKTIACIFLPLIISVAGVILCFADEYCFGISLMIIGSVIAILAYNLAADVQKKVGEQVKNLNTILDTNARI